MIYPHDEILFSNKNELLTDTTTQMSLKYNEPKTRHKRIHTAWVHVYGIPKEAKLICSDGKPIRGTVGQMG